MSIATERIKKKITFFPDLHVGSGARNGNGGVRNNSSGLPFISKEKKRPTSANNSVVNNSEKHQSQGDISPIGDRQNEQIDTLYLSNTSPTVNPLHSSPTPVSSSKDEEKLFISLNEFKPNFTYRLSILKEIENVINAPSPFDSKETSKDIKIVLVGNDAILFSAYIKHFNFTIFASVTFSDGENILEELNNGNMIIVVVSAKIGEQSAADFIIRTKMPNVKYFVITPGTISREEKQKCIFAGAFDCYSWGSCSQEQLLGHIRGVWESSHMKRQLKNVLIREKEKPIQFDTESNQYTQDRVISLENHISVLEDFKKEAQTAILMLQEENLKLKNDIFEKSSQLKDAKTTQVASKWKIVSLKDRNRKQAINRLGNDPKENKQIISDLHDQEMALTPIQQITKTVGRLTKVSDLLDATDLKNVLQGVMSSLSNENLYAPSAKMLDQLEIDEMTKKYILQSFTDSSAALNPQTPRSKDLAKLSTEDRAKIVEIKKKNEVVLQMLSRLDYFVWSYQFDELTYMLILMYDNLGLVDEFNIPIDNLVSLSKSLQGQYLDNPYHNFRHAFDVTQMCYYYVTNSKCKAYLTKLDMLSLLTSALCHDVSHPGTTNSYQVNAQTELALTYNDQSVLENMHCSKAFSILRVAKNNIFVNLRSNEYKEVRKSMISAILSTDMTVHFELTSKFDTHVSSKLNEGMEEIFTKDIKERQLLLNVVLHSADISNMVRPPTISRKWSDLVFEEFLNQGDLEKKHGLPISPFMNREDTNQAKMSLNFIDYVVSPLFTGIAKCFAELKHFTQNLAVNRESWNKEKT